LLAQIAAVEAAGASADVAVEHRGGATGGLVAAIQEAGKLARRLNAIVLNKYTDKPQKLAAWAIASHLEAAPQRSQTGGNNPPAASPATP
jgi:hypothetical protein